MINHFDEGGMEPRRQQPERIDETIKDIHGADAFPVKYDKNRPLAGADSLVAMTMPSYIDQFDHKDKMQLMVLKHAPLSVEVLICYLNRIGLLRGMVFVPNPDVLDEEADFKMRAKIWVTSGALCIRHITSIRPELTEALVSIINDPTAVKALKFEPMALMGVAININNQKDKTPIESFVGMMIVNALEIPVPIPQIEREAEACRYLLADIFNYYHEPR